MAVPSGQRVARAMQLPELAQADLADLAPLYLDRRTRMVLRPARGRGHRGRPAPRPGRRPDRGRGARQRLIRGDRQSYLRQDPGWTPTYGPGGNVTMVDLLSAAGVVATIS